MIYNQYCAKVKFTEEHIEIDPTIEAHSISEGEIAYVMQAQKKIEKPLQELRDIVRDNPRSITCNGKEISTVEIQLAQQTTPDSQVNIPSGLKITLSEVDGLARSIQVDAHYLSDDVYEQYLEKLKALGRIQKAGGLDQEWPAKLLKNLDNQRAKIHDSAAARIQDSLRYKRIELSQEASKKIFDTFFQMWMYQRVDQLYLGEIDLLVEDEKLVDLVRSQLGLEIAIEGDIASGTHDWPSPEYCTIIHLQGQNIKERKGGLINFLQQYIKPVYRNDADDEQYEEDSSY